MTNGSKIVECIKSREKQNVSISKKIENQDA